MTATDTQEDRKHSPLGASSAERWMNCPGSNILLNQLHLPETDEPEYRSLGKAAHEAAAYCLEAVSDTWEIVGQKFLDVEVDQEMADAVQMYLNHVRPLMIGATTVMVEKRIGEKARPHPQFYGTVDFAAYGPEFLDVVDYKHGEGIVVEPEENPQMMYYAYGIIYARQQQGVEVRSDRIVRLTIVQPRAFHIDGPIRQWETTVGEIIHWAENELIPAMEIAETDQSFDAGKWCRFCPAKLFCPLLSGIFGAAAKADPNAIPNFGARRLGLEYQQRDAVKFYMKALEDEVYRRNSIGHTVPGTKLVQKQAKRVWQASVTVKIDGADKTIPIAAYLKGEIGNDAFTPPELRSPADMEKVSPAAKLLVKEYAYTPNTGLTVALESDRKQEVKVEKTADIFAHMIPADEPMEHTNE